MALAVFFNRQRDARNGSGPMPVYPREVFKDLQIRRGRAYQKASA
jgi:hypothetical protein